MLKNIFVVALSLVVSLAGTALPQNVQRVFTLEDSVSTAMMNSQDILLAKEQLHYSKQSIDEVKGQIYPKIDLNISASSFNNAVPTVLPPSFNSIYLPASSSLSNDGSTYYTGRLALWQYLYAGGRYKTNLRLAEIKYSETQSQYEAMKNNIELEVKKSFYNCLYIKEKIKIFEKAILRGGAKSAKLSLDYAVTKHDYEKSVLKFLSTVGLELDTIIDISGELIPPADAYELEKCLAWAYQYRPELRQTQFQETMDGLRVNLSMLERFPTITLGANLDRVGDDLTVDSKSWNATINMNLPLFDGWTSSARIKQGKNQARQGQLRRAQIEDQVRFDVRSAFLDYNFWKKQLGESSRLAVSQNDTEGAISKLDTLYQAIVSQAVLEWAVGKSLK